LLSERRERPANTLFISWRARHLLCRTGWGDNQLQLAGISAVYFECTYCGSGSKFGWGGNSIHLLRNTCKIKSPDTPNRSICHLARGSEQFDETRQRHVHCVRSGSSNHALEKLPPL